MCLQDDGLHVVETKAHLHIPMASGNIMKVPLAAVQEEDDPINITTELTRSGMWKHIDSQTRLQPKVSATMRK
jgi:hypothetical protein